MKMRLSQLQQSGATTGQAAVWTGTEWAPGTTGSALHASRSVNTATAGQDTLTLGATPYEESLQLWKNGLLLGSGYTVAGPVVTFSPALAAADVIVDHYWTTTAGPPESVLSSPTPAFVPSDVSGLSMHYDAGTLAGADGSAVGSWTDSSPNARHATQASPTLQPTLRKTSAVVTLPNGKAVVDFDGGDWLSSPAFTSIATGTLFVVAKADTVTAARWLFDGGSGARQTVFYDTNSHAFFAGTVVSGGTTDTSAHVFAATFPGGPGAVLRRDGVQIATGDVGAQGLTIAHIGVESATTGGFWDGWIAEVAYYNRVLTGTEIADVEAYLKTKYATP